MLLTLVVQANTSIHRRIDPLKLDKTGWLIINLRMLMRLPLYTLRLNTIGIILKHANTKNGNLPYKTRRRCWKKRRFLMLEVKSIYKISFMVLLIGLFITINNITKDADVLVFKSKYRLTYGLWMG